MTPFHLFAADVLACLRFYTRLPIPPFAFEPAPHDLRDFGRAVRATPLAGAIIGCLGALALGLASVARMPASVAAGLTLTALVLTTGVFHEDGLADTADGLGGGASPEKKLEIMKDSRIGSYGGIALSLSLLLRWATLTSLIEINVWTAISALIAVNAVSRAAGLFPLGLLQPARADGAAFAAARPLPQSLALAGVIAFGFGLLPMGFGMAGAHCVLAMAAACCSALAMTWIAKRQIGGQTGDIAGAAQQLAEIAMLCVLSARASLT